MNWKKACVVVWTLVGVLLLAALAGFLWEKTVPVAQAQSQVIMPRDTGSYQISCAQIQQELQLQYDGDYQINYQIRCYRVDTATGQINGYTVF
ncbi:MAG TPA: hypothetical protein PKW95_19990 [bacterium]|nr:hypothetical protein [bacterium]